MFIDDDIVGLHRRALAAASVVVGMVTPDELTARTPCVDWDLGQLLAHMVGQHHGFSRAISDGDADADAFAPIHLAAGELQSRWRESVEDMQRAVATVASDARIRLAEIDAQRTFELRDVLAMQLLDTAVHTWDLAAALRRDFRPDPDVEDQVARTADSIPAGEARNKTRAFAQPTSSDTTDRWQQTLTKLGRTPTPRESVGHSSPSASAGPTHGDRVRLGSGAVWEPVVGYSRAVRTGPYVAIAGTTAAADGGPVGGSDAAAQTREVLSRITRALEGVGATVTDVVRTRIFTTDITHWEAIGRAHGEVFGDIRPASSMLEVRSLIHPALLVEIEADAVVSTDDDPSGRPATHLGTGPAR